MFNKAQHIDKMNTLKKSATWLSMAFAFVFVVSSCSSVSNMPNDEVYYSKKAKNSSEYNWNDFQKNAQSYNDGKSKSNSNSGDLQEGNVYSSAAPTDDISTTVEGENFEGDYQYVDDYYDNTYEERINRFGSNSSGSNFDYYDGYYGNSACNCGGGSNWSMSFGMGMGYGMGYYGMGYGYGGFPYYGYPYYGYPFYNSYSAGYAAGYNAGYWNGAFGYPYYGYPVYGYPYYGYGGGGYPDYYASSGYYGPRGSRTSGTTIPVSRSSRSPEDGDGMKRGDDTYVSGTGNAAVVGGRSGNVITSQSGGSAQRLDKPVEVSQNDISTVVSRNGAGTTGTVSKSQISTQEPLQKPSASKQNVVSGRTYEKPSSGSKMPEPKYQKPKSYQSLPSQKVRSSQEYVSPANRAPVTKSMTTKTSPYSRERKPATANSQNTTITNSRSSGTSNYSSPTRSSSTSSPTRSYSSPTRSSSSSSYSAPSRSSGSTYNSGSRSSGSSTRSSGSTTRSSGSSSTIKR